MFVIESFKKPAHAQRVFQSPIYRKPDLPGALQLNCGSQRDTYRDQMKLSDMKHPDLCCFFPMRDHVQKLLEDLLDNERTSMQTNRQLVSNKELRFLKDLKEEIEALRSAEENPGEISEESIFVRTSDLMS